jgi:hypothetical protein
MNNEVNVNKVQESPVDIGKFFQGIGVTAAVLITLTATVIALVEWQDGDFGIYMTLDYFIYGTCSVFGLLWMFVISLLVSRKEEISEGVKHDYFKRVK